MHPLLIVLGAALLDVGANMAINRSLGFRHKGWGFLGILLVLCAFTMLSEAVSTGRIDLAVAYATWGAIGILGTALGGLLLFGERLKPVGWAGILVMAQEQHRDCGDQCDPQPFPERERNTNGDCFGGLGQQQIGEGDEQPHRQVVEPTGVILRDQRHAGGACHLGQDGARQEGAR